MKKFLQFSLSLFFASWLVYQSALMLEAVYLFLILLAGACLLLVGLVRYLYHKNRWY